ncbi:Aryl hydrocarbon receptor [Plakobranchus ocellatus]|uniref:Aryl hydrocarbon receptor n=1 Tax=Plakobranchus ocellatus TaxID=259542 RepID=A0AAV4AZL1_9GAST|nr:Aryl hydrocarbon receptor [Plakobranchus ocellatus]
MSHVKEPKNIKSDIIHQSVMELIHSEDREEFKRQLTWNALLPGDKTGISLHEIMLPDNSAHLHRSFTVRFRCLLDNTSGFITLEINGWIRVLHGQGPHADEPQLALFATCSPFGPLSLFDIPSREMTFKTKHKMDFSPVTMDSR